LEQVIKHRYEVVSIFAGVCFSGVQILKTMKSLVKSLVVLLVILSTGVTAQRNQWQPDSTAYQYLSKGDNPQQFRSDRLSGIEVDQQRFKSNPGSIRWTVPPSSGSAILMLDLGDMNLRDFNIYTVCSRNNVVNTLNCFVNTAAGGRYRLTTVVKENVAGFHLPCTEWHQMGQYLAGTFTSISQQAELEHVTSITFEAGNSADTTILWIDEIKAIQPRGPVCVINFNRYRDQADTTLTPYLLQQGIKANIDFNYSFAINQVEEAYNAVHFFSVGLGRIDTLVHQYGWSCNSHGSYYDQLPYLSPQNRQELISLDSFINAGFDARWVFCIPKDNVTPQIMKEISDYGQFRSIRRQLQDIQNLPVSNPFDFHYFRPTSALAGPNLNGTPLYLSEMKEYVDSCVKHKGLIVLDFGTIVDTPSTLYTDVETTLFSDAVGLIEYVDSLGLPFLNFEDVWGDDTAYVPALTASDDLLILSGTQPEGLNVLQNDMLPPGDVPQLSILYGPLFGVATVSGDSIIYDANPACFDTDTLIYVLSNGILSDTATVRIRRMANVFSGEKTYYCNPNRYVVELNIQGGVAPHTYLWSEGSSVDSLELDGGNTYLVTIIDSDGCQLIDSVFLPNRIKPEPYVYNSVQCGSGIPTCHVVSPVDTIKWYADSLGANLLQTGGSTYLGVIDSTTTIYVSIDYGSCESNLVPVTILFEQPAVSISVESDTVGCPGTTFILRAVTGEGLLYKWKRNGQSVQNGSNSKLYTEVPGTYTVDVIRPEDTCITVSPPYMLLTPDTAHVFTDSLFIVCAGDSIRLFTYSSSQFSYMWYKDGVLLSNASSYELWVLDSGLYEVQVSGPDTCLLVSGQTWVSKASCSVGLSDAEEWIGMQVYPVPAIDRLNLTSKSDLSEDAVLNIYDLAGRLVYKSQNLQYHQRIIVVDISSLSPGAYVAELQSKEGFGLVRFLKQ
jgi:Secretion system C-terminal sorting domain